MKRTESFRSRLNRAINGAAKVILWSEELRQSQEIARIKAKAEAYIENNPQPRAVFLLG